MDCKGGIKVKKELKTVFKIENKSYVDLTDEIKNSLCEQVTKAIKEYIFSTEIEGYSKYSGINDSKST